MQGGKSHFTNLVSAWSNPVLTMVSESAIFFLD